METKIRSMFTQLLYDFLNKNENYDRVLGYFEPDGCKVKGLYDQFAMSKVKFQFIIYYIEEFLDIFIRRYNVVLG